MDSWLASLSALVRLYRVKAITKARAMTANNLLRRPHPRWSPELQIIFSSRDGCVWASWPNANAVNLGRHEDVAAMMRDFLAQDALGKRLTTQYPSAR
jgi:hypothetical protein